MTSTGNRDISIFARRSTAPSDPMLNWQHCHDDGEWEQASAHNVSPQAGHLSGENVRRAQWRWGWQGPVALLLLCILVGVVWQQDQRETGRVMQELQRSVDAEAQLRTYEDPTVQTVYLDLLEMQLVHETQQLQAVAEPGEPLIGLEMIHRERSRMVVEAEVQGAADTSYRQTRVYAQTAQGWTRTLPTARDWGEARQVEGQYLILNYHARDEEAVAAVLARADKLYFTLYTGLFPELPGVEKVIVNVDPARPPGQMAQPRPEFMNLVVASPAATLLPDSLAPDDVLLQSIALALYAQLAEAVKMRYQMAGDWKPIRDGLGLWLLWPADLPLSHWRTPVVRWVFWDPAIETLPGHSDVPHFAWALCEEHQLWMTTPVDIGVPVICLHYQEVERTILAFRSLYSPPVKPMLPPLPHQSPEMEGISGPVPVNGPMALAVQFATLFEYTAAVYGPDSVPVLLAALPEHHSFYSLIPEVFGISAVEFEQGWREFLADYGEAAP